LVFPTRLYSVHPDGSNLTPLTNNTQGKATNPIWAEDGTLFYGQTGVSADLDGLYQYLPTENNHTLLIPGSEIHPLSISPDGEFLLFEQDHIFKIWQFRLQEVIAEISNEEDSQPTFVGWILTSD
jgi:Tol biopolymer transport system component